MVGVDLLRCGDGFVETKAVECTLVWVGWKQKHDHGVRVRVRVVKEKHDHGVLFGQLLEEEDWKQKHDHGVLFGQLLEEEDGTREMER